MHSSGTRIPPDGFCFKNWLFMSVSWRPPETSMPVPTGPAAAAPALGTLGLLLSCTKLFMNTQQECVWVIRLMPLFGHAPSCGAGLSPFWLLVSNPSSLLSNSEFFTTRLPPEFEPE